MGIELSQLSYEEYPNIWEWIGRINKLRQELETCNSPFVIKNIPE